MRCVDHRGLGSSFACNPCELHRRHMRDSHIWRTGKQRARQGHSRNNNFCPPNKTLNNQMKSIQTANQNQHHASTHSFSSSTTRAPNTQIQLQNKQNSNKINANRSSAPSKNQVCLKNCCVMSAWSAHQTVTTTTIAQIFMWQRWHDTHKSESKQQHQHDVSRSCKGIQPTTNKQTLTNQTNKNSRDTHREGEREKQNKCAELRAGMSTSNNGGTKNDGGRVQKQKQGARTSFGSSCSINASGHHSFASSGPQRMRKRQPFGALVSNKHTRHGNILQTLPCGNSGGPSNRLHLVKRKSSVRTRSHGG